MILKRKMKETVILKVSRKLETEEDKKNILLAAQYIREGKTVCMPTETVYGLGANALCTDAVAKIFQAKGRPQDNPLIIHVSSVQDIDKYCVANENKHFSKISHLMPGPLTLVLKKRDIVPSSVCAGLETVAVRFPKNEVAASLIRESGVPIAAPSANISGRPSPTNASHVIEDMFGKVDMIIDAGPCDVGLESTIVSLVSEIPVLLRPGAVTYEELCEIFGRVDVSPAILAEMKPEEKAAAPGMKYKHYAPRAEAYLVSGEKKKVLDFIREKQRNEKCAVICFDQDKEQLFEKNLLLIGDENDPEEQARRIFDALRKTDELDNIQSVYIHVNEDKSGIRLATFNRLLKAAAFRVISL